MRSGSSRASRSTSRLDTKTKLFCGCPTAVRPVEEHDGEFCRYLRATASELGEIDRAAEEEMKEVRRFRYLAYDTTCLVENDDEPPSPLNEEALEVTLEAARTFGMTPIEQVHVMRKLVIDGSNTSGFQRTALVAVGGVLPNGGVVESICLEEEAAQRVEDACFSLDRLGIPLVEITTSPCLRTPRGGPGDGRVHRDGAPVDREGQARDRDDPAGPERLDPGRRPGRDQGGPGARPDRRGGPARGRAAAGAARDPGRARGPRGLGRGRGRRT